MALLQISESVFGPALAVVSRNFSSAFSLESSLIYVPGVLLVALLIEALNVGFRNSTLSRLRQVSWTDWFLYLLQQLNLSLVFSYAITLGFLYVVYALLYRGAIAIVPSEIQIGSAIAYFFAVDCLGYWYHRMLHRVPALWNIHHVHHSAPMFNVVNSFRSHPIEGTLSRIFVAIPAAALFVPQLAGWGTAVLVYLLATKLLNLLQHSQVTSDFGLFGKVFVSPAHHRIHHSQDPRHYDKNFGNSLIIWDKLFGTYADASREEVHAIRIGLDDHDESMPVLRYLWDRYLRTIRVPIDLLTQRARKIGQTIARRT